MGRRDIDNDTSMLQAEIKIRDEKLALTEAEQEREREQLTEQINDLRRRLDSESEERRKLTALLTHQRAKAEVEPEPAAPKPPPPRKGLRGWLHRITA